MTEINDLLQALATQPATSVVSDNIESSLEENKDEEIYYDDEDIIENEGILNTMMDEDDFTENEALAEEEMEENIPKENITEEKDASNIYDSETSAPVTPDTSDMLRECPGCKASSKDVIIHPFINKLFIAECLACGHAVISYDYESTLKVWNTRYTDSDLHNLNELNKELAAKAEHMTKEFNNAVNLLEESQSTYENLLVDYKEAVKKCEEAERAYEELKNKAVKLLNLESKYQEIKKQYELELRTIEDNEKNTRYNLKEREFTTGTMDKATRKELQNIMYAKMGKEAEIKLINKLIGEL